MAMTHANLSNLIRNRYLHQAFSTRWVTVPIQPKERDTTWRKLNEMWRVPCFYLFQIVPCNMMHNNPAALPGWATIMLFRCRWHFVRNDIIANDVSPISGVRRSWKTFIYRLHRADLKGTKECSGMKAAQFCGYIIFILLSVRVLQCPEKKN